MDKIHSTAPAKRHKGDKTIRFSIEQTQYADFLHSVEFARLHLETLLRLHSERFPSEMANGYVFNGYVFNGFTEVSAKLGLRQRRVRLQATGEVCTLAPSFVLPYMVAKTEHVEKALLGPADLCGDDRWGPLHTRCCLDERGLRACLGGRLWNLRGRGERP